MSDFKKSDSVRVGRTDEGAKKVESDGFTKVNAGGSQGMKSDDDGPLPRIGSNAVSKADIVERRKELRKAGVRFPPWKVDAAVVRTMRDIILYGCMNVDPVQKAGEGYFSDKYSLQGLAAEIKVALPWSLRLSTEELIQIILSTEGVKSEKSAKGTLISMHLGQEVARHYRKGRSLRKHKMLINEGWYKEDEVDNWRAPGPMVNPVSQIPERVVSSNSDRYTSEECRH